MIPMILGIPFPGSIMGVGLLLGIWTIVGLIGYIFLMRPKPTKVYSSKRTVLIDGKVKTLKDGEYR